MSRPPRAAAGSLFVTGTDTGVGKTLIAAGIARAASDAGADVGVMKPFASAEAAAPGRFRSDDAAALAEAARSGDPEELVNPQFFATPASPYTAARRLGARADVGAALAAYGRLAGMHDVMVVEGAGGAMAPILEGYFMADLARDMGLPALVVSGNRIGSISHAVMTVMACRARGLRVAGVVVSCPDPGGYPAGELAGDLGRLAGAPVLGAVPRLAGAGPDAAAAAVREAVGLERLGIRAR